MLVRRNMVSEKREHESEEAMPDRPLECSECKKPISVVYTEIVGQTKVCTSMCSDCPCLKKHLRGVPMQGHGTHREEAPAGLTCGNCGTTLESLRVGLPTGCSICYEVFDTALVTELFASEKIPPHVSPGKKSVPLHVGRAPGVIQEVNATSRLLALNEALSDTLKKENYEQAALLRDQIKALTSRKKEEDEKQQK